MKHLVVFYSRTGTTKKVAESIAKNLKCDIEEIFDIKKRKGALGYLSAGKDGTFKRLTKIKELKKNISSYDIVVIGSPVWSFNLSSPIRTFISENRYKLKKAAFFITKGGSEGKKIFDEMEKISGKTPIAVFEITTKEVVNNRYDGKVKEFVDKIKLN